MCPLELCSTEPLLWGKGRLPWEGACPLPVPSSRATLAAGCSPRLAGRLLLVAVLWGHWGGDCRDASVELPPLGAFHLPQSSRASLMCYIVA